MGSTRDDRGSVPVKTMVAICLAAFAFLLIFAVAAAASSSQAPASRVVTVVSVNGETALVRFDDGVVRSELNPFPELRAGDRVTVSGMSGAGGTVTDILP